MVSVETAIKTIPDLAEDEFAQQSTRRWEKFTLVGLKWVSFIFFYRERDPLPENVAPRAQLEHMGYTNPYLGDGPRHFVVCKAKAVRNASAATREALPLTESEATAGQRDALSRFLSSPMETIDSSGSGLLSASVEAEARLDLISKLRARGRPQLPKIPPRLILALRPPALAPLAPSSPASSSRPSSSHGLQRFAWSAWSAAHITAANHACCALIRPRPTNIQALHLMTVTQQANAAKMPVLRYDTAHIPSIRLRYDEDQRPTSRPGKPSLVPETFCRLRLKLDNGLCVLGPQNREAAVDQTGGGILLLKRSPRLHRRQTSSSS
ncbi:hypothetical protein CONLIGDRAFT_648158 [Coniochaeta ligniaria NRRL 30616]|uniref:Uncharacterized protein n=1 Tax=Coniochaeta ligniaria NRRL 30616 TaxID=1408157 RepID=A0A1J7J5L5_9PEZI|nr:hypothetical protein CONLIGDRAFT_648158 [Coniochaeta ligniaria NRRL 30616]